MRLLTDHTTNPVNEAINIAVLDEPGQGGACHEYDVNYWNEKLIGTTHQRISFQNGPIKEFGVNGITQEVLLAIVIDRLRSFQAGPFANEYNGHALRQCESALDWLQRRTKERLARGVEGTNTL